MTGGQSASHRVVPFVDLRAAYHRLRHEIDAAIAEVVSGGWYILGEQTHLFEAEFAAYITSDGHAVGVASGTDALLLALKALNVGHGDEVITVSHTAVATVAAIELSGARPVLVDVDPVTFTMNPEQIEAVITPRTRAIVPVHLYGQTADMDPIMALAARHGLVVVEDCAQAHGARYKGRPAGGMGDAAAFSFYPTKNLAAMGDGGAVFTRRPDVAERVRMLRQYGWKERYVSHVAGFNSRLDEVQAAILRVRLRHLDEENAARRRLAAVYDDLLREAPVDTLGKRPDCDHVYHLYVIRTADRDGLQAHLQRQGVGTGIHYPVPIHRQPAYRRLGYGPGSLPVTEELAGRILSLPMFPDLTEDQIETVVSAICSYFT